MKSLFAIFLFFVAPLYASAQINNRAFRVNNGGDIRTVISTRDRYLYDGFREGKVYFRNGRVSVARLNYSFFHSEIQFINPKNDTLLLSDNDFISRIVINNDVFYYQKKQGHIQNIGDYGKVMLGRKQQLLFMGSEKNAGYNQYSSASAVSSYSHFTNRNGEIQTLSSGDKLILRKKTDFYLIDRNLRFSLANRAGLLKIYPDHKKALNNYLKDNQINFLEENDLVKTLEFCQSL